MGVPGQVGDVNPGGGCWTQKTDHSVVLLENKSEWVFVPLCLLTVAS